MSRVDVMSSECAPPRRRRFVLHLGDDLRARRRIVERACAASRRPPDFGPARQQRRADARARRRVRILTRRDVDARRARLLHQRDDVSLCPQTSAPSALMCEMWTGMLRFASDANRFVHRADQSDRVRALVAQVRVVDAALRRGDLRELDDFFGRRVAARRVVEAGRHADRAVHPCARARSRASNRAARASALPRDMPTHRAAHRSLADVDGGVRADAVLRPAVELLADVDRPPPSLFVMTVVTPCMRYGRLRVAAAGAREVAGGVRVRIDESGRDDRAPSRRSFAPPSRDPPPRRRRR